MAARPVNKDFKKTLTSASEQMARDVGGMVDTRVRLRPRKAVYGADALAHFGDDTNCAITRRANDPETPVGLLIAQEDAVTLAATMLMMPGATEMTEELESAFSELVNIMIGTWRSEEARTGYRLANDIESRSSEQMDNDRLGEFLAENDLALVAIPMEIDDTKTWFGFFGHAAWIHDPEAAGDDPALDVTPAAEDASESAPAPARRRPNFPDAGAIIVDESGKVRDWITEQIECGALEFVKSRPEHIEVDEATPVLIFAPNPEAIRSLTSPKWVICRGK